MDSRFQPLCVMLANQFIALVNLHLRHNLDAYLQSPEFQSQLQSFCQELYACFNLQHHYNVSQWLVVQNLLSKEVISLPIIDAELAQHRTDMQRFERWLKQATKTNFYEKDFNYLVANLHQSFMTK